MFTRVFGGTLVHELVGKGCPHKSSRPEPFMCIGLDVNGKNSVLEGLAAFVSGEMLSGDNAYHCGVCDAKVDTLKRCRIGELPNTLVLHLKRFELNYDTFTKQKLNSRVEFPTTLDMKPFTVYADEGVGNGGVHGSGGGSEEPTTLSSSATVSVTSTPTTLYQLRGVLVHSGTANCGHYYSFIKERRSDESGGGVNSDDHVSEDDLRWYQFNDDLVSEFDVTHLGEECFGGVIPGRIVKGRQMRGRDIVNNAFMIFYDRVDVRYTTTVSGSGGSGDSKCMEDDKCVPVAVTGSSGALTVQTPPHDSKRRKMDVGDEVEAHGDASVSEMIDSGEHTLCSSVTLPRDIAVEVHSVCAKESLKRLQFRQEVHRLLSMLVPIVSRHMANNVTHPRQFVQVLLTQLFEVDLRLPYNERADHGMSAVNALTELFTVATQQQCLELCDAALSVVLACNGQSLFHWLIAQPHFSGVAVANVLKCVVERLEGLAAPCLSYYDRSNDEDGFHNLLPPRAPCLEKSGE